MWHISFVVPAPPSFHAGLTDRFTHLFSFPSRAICDTSLGKLHGLLPFFFLNIHIFGLWEKAGELKSMQVLIVVKSTSISFGFSFCSKPDPQINENTLNISKHLYAILATSFASVIFFISLKRDSILDFYEIRTCCDLVYLGEKKKPSKLCDIEWESWKSTLLIKEISWTRGFVFPPWLKFNFSLHLLKGWLS